MYNKLKNFLKRIKDIILICLGIFFIFCALIMITEDITVTISFGILAVVFLFFGRDYIVDIIYNQKRKKLKNDYKNEKLKLDNELKLITLKTQNETAKKNIKMQKGLNLEKIETYKTNKVKNIEHKHEDIFVNGKNALNALENLSNGYAFEEYIASLLNKLNYLNIQVTQASNDYGIDVLAEKDNIKYAIQCKLCSRPVGNKAVQEAFSGKSFYDCHIAVVVTNNIFTKHAIQLAQHNGVLL